MALSFLPLHANLHAYAVSSHLLAYVWGIYLSCVFATLETGCLFRAFPTHTEVKWPIHYILDEVGTHGKMPNTILAYR
jgi:hypothetical protein